MSGMFDVPDEEFFDEVDEPPVSSVGDEKPKANFLNDEEDGILRYVRKVRMDLIAKMTNNNGQFVVPEKGTDKILLDQCLSGLADEQFKRAKGRKDIQANEAAADWADTLARTLMSRSARRSKRAATPEERRLPSDIKPTNVQAGEMDEGCKPLTMADIRK